MRALFVNFYLRKDSVVIVKFKRLASVALAAVMAVSAFVTTGVLTSTATATAAATLKDAPESKFVSAVDSGVNVKFKPVSGVTKYRVYYRWAKDAKITRVATVTASNANKWKSAYIPLDGISPFADLEELSRLKGQSESDQLFAAEPESTGIRFYFAVRGFDSADKTALTNYKWVQATWNRPYDVHVSNEVSTNDYRDCGGDKGRVTLAYSAQVGDSYKGSTESGGNPQMYVRDFTKNDWVAIPSLDSGSATVGSSYRLLDLTAIADKYDCIDDLGRSYFTCRPTDKTHTYWDCCFIASGLSNAKTENYSKWPFGVNRINVVSLNVNGTFFR